MNANLCASKTCVRFINSLLDVSLSNLHFALEIFDSSTIIVCRFYDRISLLINAFSADALLLVAYTL